MLQCGVCYGRYSSFIRILKSSVDVPIWLLLNTVTNMDHFFEESDRFLLQNLFSRPEENEKGFQDLLLRYALRDKKQKFAFHACQSCLRKSPSMTVVEHRSLTTGDFNLVRLSSSLTSLRPVFAARTVDKGLDLKPSRPIGPPAETSDSPRDHWMA